MAFRKRKRKSANSRTIIIHDDNNDNDDTITDISSSSTSLSFQFQQHSLDNGARITSKDDKKKKKKQRKQRKMRIKATQRSYQTVIESNDNKPFKLHSNLNVYTQDYLNTLKNENKSIPDHIKNSIEDENDIINDSRNDIDDDMNKMMESSDDNDNDDDDDDDNDIDETMRAKILTSKLKRRTKALANAIDKHAQNTNNRNNNNKNNNNNRFGTHFGERTGKLLDETEHDIQKDDQLHQFEPLGKFKNSRDEMQELIDEHNQNGIDLTNDDEEDFEMQQMEKTGIKFNKNIIVIDDNNNDNDNFQKPSDWNICNDNDGPLSLDDVYKMIDNDINGRDNMVRPPMGSYNVSYEQVETEYVEIDKNIQLNKKQYEAIEEKQNFFHKLNNESTAYLNCLSEKSQLISKYLEMDIHLRQKRHDLLQKYQCLNELESYHQAFYPNDYIKDINAAKAYEKLSDLNATINIDSDGIEEKKDGNNQSIFTLNNNEDINVWNEEEETLDKRKYLLHKKRRNEYREEQRMNKKQKLNENNNYSNIYIENNYFISREKLLKEMKCIFDDTRIEYRGFDGLSKILEEWKNKYRNEYNAAYISISIPKLIAPFVKLELIEWNALKHRINIDKESDDQSTIIIPPKLFINMNWYQLISNYGTDENGEMNTNDSDDIIVPTLISALIIPELINIIKYDWNPYSKQETDQLLLQINCALEHIDCYKQFESKIELLTNAIYQRCNECVSELIDLKCIPSMLISKILPNFKRLPNKPLDCIDSNSNQTHDIKSNLPTGLMYEYIKNRVFNALQLLECLSIIIIINNNNHELILQITQNIYQSIIEGFITYLARCPLRSAKNDIHSQIIILHDLSEIVNKIFMIKDKWASNKQNDDDEDDDDDDDDDDDIEMSANNVDSKTIKLPQYLLKHIKRSVVEINNNINFTLKTNPNVTQNLNCLNNLISGL